MGLLSKLPRRGLANNLVKRGVPLGIALLLAELSYPGGEYAQLVSDLKFDPSIAAHYTNGYLYEGWVPTLLDVLQKVLPVHPTEGEQLPEWYILIYRAAAFDESSAIFLDYLNSSME